MLNSVEQLGPHGPLVVNSFVAVAPIACMWVSFSCISLSSLQFDDERES